MNAGDQKANLAEGSIPKKARARVSLVAHLFVDGLFYRTEFFALTGITLNHPTWFGGQRASDRHLSGELSPGLLVDEVKPTRSRRRDTSRATRA